MANTFSDPIEITFTARVDGTEQRYVELRPIGFDPSKEIHVMIALHGSGGDRWQYVRGDLNECRGARDAAANYGFLYVSPDYRAHTSWMGPKAEADLVQIIEELRGKYKVGRLLLVGASMGGSSALTFGVLHPEMIDGICSQKATANHVEFPNYQDDIIASFGGTKEDIPEEYEKRSAEFFPERLTMPISFTCGGQDQAVPPQSVLRLAEKLRQMGRNVLMIHDPDAGHRAGYEETVTAMEWVIRQTLG